MTLYYYVSKGQIVEGPRTVPVNWRNTSGFNLLSQAELKERGWLPEVRTGFEPFNPATQKRTGPVRTINANDVTAAYTVTDKTPQEIDDEKDGEADNILDNKFNRTILEVLFQMENRIRALEADSPITKGAFRNALKAIYKGL